MDLIRHNSPLNLIPGYKLADYLLLRGVRMYILTGITGKVIAR